MNLPRLQKVSHFLRVQCFCIPLCSMYATVMCDYVTWSCFSIKLKLLWLSFMGGSERYAHSVMPYCMQWSAIGLCVWERYAHSVILKKSVFDCGHAFALKKRKATVYCCWGAWEHNETLKSLTVWGRVSEEGDKVRKAGKKASETHAWAGFALARTESNMWQAWELLKHFSRLYTGNSRIEYIKQA